jgi:signal peptidase
MSGPTVRGSEWEGEAGARARGATSATLGVLVRLLRLTLGLALLLVLAVVFAGVLPTYFGAESFTVYSGSMEPNIHVGALAVVRPAKVSAFHAGDVITYRLPTQPDVVVTHRLIAIEQGEDGRIRFRTKGDANNVEDLVLVDQGAVLGRVVYSVPYLGYLIEFSKSGRGRLLLVGLPALLLALDFLRDRLTKQRRSLTGGLSQPAVAAQGERFATLLARGRQALEAGHPDLALRAADGVLAADPRNEAAWLLKVHATDDPAARRLLLQTALTVLPGAALLTQELETHDRPLRDLHADHNHAGNGAGATDAAG